MLIALEGMQFYAHHGHYDAEREKGNNFLVDAYIITNESNEDINDELERALNYEIIFECVKKEMGQPTRLLETLTVNILNELQKKLPGASSLRVRVSKLNPPLEGKVNRAFVELERKLK